MNNSIISEGKTTTEAIENGLKKLNLSKEKVDIKVLENKDKKSFFSILSPRVVKVELTPKVVLRDHVQNGNHTHNNDFIQNIPKTIPIVKKYKDVDKEVLTNSEQKIIEFMKEFMKKLELSNTELRVSSQDSSINVVLIGEESAFLIGYRGEVLNSLQTILSTIINKDKIEKINIMLDIAGYKIQREKALEGLAVKYAEKVLQTGKSLALEPMTSYERKIIHSKLQENDKIKTYSVGEDPYRKIIIDVNKNKKV